MHDTMKDREMKVDGKRSRGKTGKKNREKETKKDTVGITVGIETRRFVTCIWRESERNCIISERKEKRHTFKGCDLSNHLIILYISFLCR